MKYGDRSWLKPKKALKEGVYVLDKWGRLLPNTSVNRARAVAMVRVMRKRNLVTPTRAVSIFKRLCKEAQDL